MINRINSFVRAVANGAVVLCLWLPASAQTASDACGYNAGNEYPVNTTCTFSDFDKPTSFVADYNPSTCTSGNYDDAYGWFTATSNSTYITYDPNTNQRAIMHVFTGACGSLTQVGCIDAGGGGNNAELLLQTVEGTNYMVRIQLYNNNTVMNGRLCVWSPVTTNWCGFPAISQIPVGYPCTPRPFVKPDANTAIMNPTGCSGGNYDDAFGWFTATATSTIITYDPDASQRAIMHVFSGTCGSLTQVNCVDAGANGSNAVLTIPTSIGVNYLIRIQLRNGNTAMNGTICITTPPPNDDCAGALVVTANAGQTCTAQTAGSVYLATASPESGATCAGTEDDDVWFRFTALGTSHIVSLNSVAGSSTSMNFQVFSGACGSMTSIGCSTTSTAPTLTLTGLTGGNTYHVRVYTNTGTGGQNTTFNVCVVTPPPNDDCAGAVVVTVNAGQTCTAQTAGSVYLATASPESGATCAGTEDDDVWFRFTALGTSHIVSLNSVAGSSTSMNFQVFSGACGSMTSIGCSTTGIAPTLTLTGLTGGNTYHVRVYTNTGTGGQNTTFNVCVITPPPNDDCAGAIDLFVASSCYMQYSTNVGSTASGTTPNPSCGGTPSTDVWFRFVAPASGAVRIFTEAGTLTDAAFQLYSGSCGSLSLVSSGCDNDGGSGANDLMPYLDRRCTPLTGGATYYLRVWGYSGAVGSFGLCVYGPDVFPTPAQDCGGGFTVCGSSSINNNSDWTGCTTDLTNANRGCLLSNERQGTWYYFSPRSMGNVAFTIQPTDNLGQPANIDYDFAIWGPSNAVSCPPSGAPLRCSYAYPPSAGTWQTGMAAGNSDTSEGSGGGSVNGFVAPINVAAGDVGKVYMMYVDNFDANGQSFNLTWTLSAANQLDCSILPVSIIDFSAKAQLRSVRLHWVAQDIASSDLFLIERSVDGHTFENIGALDAVRSGNGTTDHVFIDAAPLAGLNYYRITTLSADGSSANSATVSVIYHPTDRTLVAVPNPASSALQFHLADLDQEEQLEALVVDASGRLVSKEQYSVNGPDPTISMSVAHLATGYYMVKLVNGHGEQVGTGRFVKE